MNPDNKCLKCGRSLKNSQHHFFCNDCYVPGLIHSQEFRNKKKELKKRYMKKIGIKPLTLDGGKDGISEVNR